MGGVCAVAKATTNLFIQTAAATHSLICRRSPRRPASRLATIERVAELLVCADRSLLTDPMIGDGVVAPARLLDETEGVRLEVGPVRLHAVPGLGEVSGESMPLCIVAVTDLVREVRKVGHEEDRHRHEWYIEIGVVEQVWTDDGCNERREDE